MACHGGHDHGAGASRGNGRRRWLMLGGLTLVLGAGAAIALAAGVSYTTLGIVALIGAHPLICIFFMRHGHSHGAPGKQTGADAPVAAADSRERTATGA